MWMTELIFSRFLFFSLPIAAYALVCLFWRWPFTARLWIAGIAGFIFDTINPFPFGTFIFSFLGTAIVAESTISLFFNKAQWVSNLFMGIGLSALFTFLVLFHGRFLL